MIVWIKALVGMVRGMNDASFVALASVAQSLLAWKGIFLEDIERLKEAKLKGFEAKTKAQEADADKKTAAAADAANKVIEKDHEEAMRELERQEKAIKNRKLEADAALAGAKADKAKAEAAKAKAQALQAMIEVVAEGRKMQIQGAEEELQAALQQYLQEGGKLYINEENLKSLIQLGKTPPSSTPPQPTSVLTDTQNKPGSKKK